MYISWNLNMKPNKSLRIFAPWHKPSLAYQLSRFEQNGANILSTTSKIYLQKMENFTKLASIHHNQMMFLKQNIGIYLKFQEHYDFRQIYWSPFGVNGS